MAFVRVSRDKRGYEHIYLIDATARRGKASRPRVLYWFRTPPGVMVGVERDGTIQSCTTNLEGETKAWALGSPTAWLSAVIERDLSELELGGDRPLSRALVESLH